jgi:hypothetical protein
MTADVGQSDAYKGPPAPKDAERAPAVDAGATASLTWRAASALLTWTKSPDRNRESETWMAGVCVPDVGLLMAHEICMQRGSSQGP